MPKRSYPPLTDAQSKNLCELAKLPQLTLKCGYYVHPPMSPPPNEPNPDHMGYPSISGSWCSTEIVRSLLEKGYLLRTGEWTRELEDNYNHTWINWSAPAVLAPFARAEALAQQVRYQSRVEYNRAVSARLARAKSKLVDARRDIQHLWYNFPWRVTQLKRLEVTVPDDIPPEFPPNFQRAWRRWRKQQLIVLKRQEQFSAHRRTYKRLPRKTVKAAAVSQLIGGAE